MNRRELIDRLKNNPGETWDMIIIGGGATGMGTALDAASRGYKTLLLEQSDFSKATSSRSTKLVHGGVRYMAQGDLLLVMEALHERGLMLKNAPHLTFNQEFVIPIYSVWDAILYTVGLTFYDLLAGRLSMGRSRFINRHKTLERLPLLKAQGLRGGVVYHDGQFDDSRMTVALAQSSASRGAVILNYFKVHALLKDDKGKITGVKASDEVSGDEFNFRAKAVINATGVFADDISRMDVPGSRPTIKPSQGVHIVLDKSFLQSDSAIMIPKTSDGRVLFAIPWYDAVVIGTTDTPVNDVSLEPVALEEEIGFILQTAGLYMVKPPKREDILCIFAGLRPLAANPENPSSTKEVSRRHKITLSRSGLISVIGGKWTTYRCMAEETIDRAIKAGFLENRKCVTADLNLTNPKAVDLSDRLHIYGEGSFEIRNMIIENPSLGKQLDPRLPYTAAEIRWVCRHEMPVNVEDILARRTRALLLNALVSQEIAPAVAAIMAQELGHNENWQTMQVELYNTLVKNYI
jgi:glycerol-3-phosphate dehydrogenase